MILSIVLTSGFLQCRLVPAVLQVGACIKDWCPWKIGDCN
jgi:hypothetical protein